MTLTSYAKYEIPINAWVATATGDVVCPICGNFIKDVDGVIMDPDRNVVYIEAAFHTRVIHRPWLMADDLALLCSPQCLELHNTLGGMYV